MQTTRPDIADSHLIYPEPLDEADKGKKWHARLKLRYAAKHGNSVLLEHRHTGPLLVQKPFYPEGKRVCHTYIIHPPGGVVGGDKLALEVVVDRGAHAVLTTPAAGKFYRCAGPRATQVNRLNVAAGAALEWLPQETIIYNQANAKMRTIVRLDRGARFIGWEMICLGLPASNQPFTRGHLDQRFDLLQDNQPIFIEPFQVQDQDPVLTARWGLAGLPAIGIMIATTGERDLLNAIRNKTSVMDLDGQFAVTRINGLTICRFLGNDVYAGFKFFLRAWELLRPAIFEREVCMPRIWST